MRGKSFLIFIVGLIAFVAGISPLLIPFDNRDDTDPPGGFSGLRLFTDHRTGCQYLAARNASLTPRLDAQGRQICNQGSK